MDNLMPSDININNDLFLGETSVQITGFHGYPSIHLVRSYLIRLNNYDDEIFYHIFEHKTGTTLVNYGPREYDQVANFIDVSDRWQVFFKDKDGLIPISTSWRH